MTVSSSTWLFYPGGRLADVLSVINKLRGLASIRQLAPSHSGDDVARASVGARSASSVVGHLEPDSTDGDDLLARCGRALRGAACWTFSGGR